MVAPFLIQIGIAAASYVISYTFRPRRKDAEKTKPEFPTSDAGAAIPVIFGTAKVMPNLLWAGDIKLTAVAEGDGGLFGSGILDDKAIVGYDYRAGLQLGLCEGPVDEVLDIVIGGKSLVHTESIRFRSSGAGLPFPSVEPAIDPLLPALRGEGASAFEVYAPKLFGGKKQEGGVTGTFRLHWGDEDQSKSTYLMERIGEENVSALGGLCYLVVEAATLGMTPYIKPIEVVLRRCPANLNPETANIGGDANPAEVLYEIATSARWGCCIPPEAIDVDAFTAVAALLYEEDMGISGQWTGATDGSSLVSEILRHIDGVLFEHPTTGRITLQLIRNNYEIETLPRLHAGNATLEFSRSLWPETINDVKVRFHRRHTLSREVDGVLRSRPGFADDVVPAQNLASIQAMGYTSQETYDFPLFSQPERAAKAAANVLRAVSVPLARATVTAFRNVRDLAPGDPFVLEFPDDSIDELVMRVAQIGSGSLEGGAVVIEAVEDVFDVSGVAYSSPGAGGEWAGTSPMEPAYRRAFELPYWHDSRRRVAAMISRPNAQHTGWTLWADEGSGYAYLGGTPYFAPVGLLEETLPQAGPATGESFVVSGGAELDTLAGTDGAGLLAGTLLAMVGDEIVAWQTVAPLGGGRYEIGGVMRGQLDTAPLEHPADTTVWFYTPVGVVISGEGTLGYPSDLSLDLKASPETARGALALDGASEMPITTASRASKPYPPGNVRVNGFGYAAWPSTIFEDATLTWSHRNRTEQAQMVAQDEAGAFTYDGTYTVDVIIRGNVVRTVEGITATSYTYTLAERIADDPELWKLVEFRITSVRLGLEGFSRTTPPFGMEDPEAEP